MTKYTLDPSTYHDSDAPTYRGETDGSLKQDEHMVHVQYAPSHLNTQAPEGMQGEGRLTGKWIFNEEPGKAEGLLQSSIELMMDTKLEPNASIGLHRHHTTEEIYYLLEGSLTVTLLVEDQQTIFELTAGDSHLVKPGESHFIRAGEQGARIIVVAAKVLT